MTLYPPKRGPLAQIDGIGRVAAPLAHQLGQSVAVIAGALDMLQSAGGADEDALRLLAREADQLRTLTDELLSIAAGHRRTP